MGQFVPKFKRTTEAIADGTGESYKQIQRYIRLTELIPEILDYVDKKRIQFTVAVDISYLDKEIQTWLFEYIKENGTIKPKQILFIGSLIWFHDEPIRFALLAITESMLIIILIGGVILETVLHEFRKYIGTAIVYGF